MTLLESLILGLVQGLTEFLPISSSGHLVIFQDLFGVTEPSLAFEILVHGATLLAIVVYFRRRIAWIVVARQWRFVAKIGVATVPIVAVALAFLPWIERAFLTPWVVVVTLGTTGALLLSLYLRPRRTDLVGAAEPTWTAALLIGVAQAVAVLPGISRSGATIVTAIWLGVAPAAAAEFSFLLGVPAIAGAILYQTGPLGAAARGGQGAELALGAVAAYVSGLVAILLVFRLLATDRFRRFGFYCLAVAAAFAAWLAGAAG